MDKIELGKVVRLHGYLGQMKVATKYDKDFNIKSIKQIIDENDNVFNVTKIFQTKDGVVVALEEIDLEKSKTYVGKMFFVDREIMKNKILIEDLKGSLVEVDDGVVLGEIVDVEDYGAAEVFFLHRKRCKTESANRRRSSLQTCQGGSFHSRSAPLCPRGQEKVCGAVPAAILFPAGTFHAWTPYPPGAVWHGYL